MDARSMRMRRWSSATAAGLAALLCAPAAATADTPPKLTTPLELRGLPSLGAELRAQATWIGDPEPTVTWQWQRCDQTASACRTIAGAVADRYTTVGEDVGRIVRVVLRLKNDFGALSARSKALYLITAPPPVPTPTPTPDPEPTAAPAPAVSAPPVAVVPPAAVVVAPAPPAVLSPFPIVRIRGRFNPKGARLTLLSVRTPNGARVSVRCTGRDCPVRRFNGHGGSYRLRAFERTLRGGTKLDLRVTREGFLGKRTTFVIRKGAAPRRTDACLDLAGKVIRCPSG